MRRGAWHPSPPARSGARPNNSKTPAPQPDNSERNLRLNFRGVPLEMVLNYLSEAAGFVILPGQADVKGKVDVWSNQPLSKDEAVQLLAAGPFGFLGDMFDGFDEIDDDEDGGDEDFW